MYLLRIKLLEQILVRFLINKLDNDAIKLIRNPHQFFERMNFIE